MNPRRDLRAARALRVSAATGCSLLALSAGLGACTHARAAASHPPSCARPLRKQGCCLVEVPRRDSPQRLCSEQKAALQQGATHVLRAPPASGAKRTSGWSCRHHAPAPLRDQQRRNSGGSGVCDRTYVRAGGTADNRRRRYRTVESHSLTLAESVRPPSALQQSNHVSRSERVQAPCVRICCLSCGVRL